jgi:hypothetical protein
MTKRVLLESLVDYHLPTETLQAETEHKELHWGSNLTTIYSGLATHGMTLPQIGKHFYDNFSPKTHCFINWKDADSDFYNVGRALRRGSGIMPEKNKYLKTFKDRSRKNSVKRINVLYIAKAFSELPRGKLQHAFMSFCPRESMTFIGKFHRAAPNAVVLAAPEVYKGG